MSYLWVKKKVSERDIFWSCSNVNACHCKFFGHVQLLTLVVVNFFRWYYNWNLVIFIWSCELTSAKKQGLRKRLFFYIEKWNENLYQSLFAMLIVNVLKERSPDFLFTQDNRTEVALWHFRRHNSFQKKHQIIYPNLKAVGLVESNRNLVESKNKTSNDDIAGNSRPKVYQCFFIYQCISWRAGTVDRIRRTE